VSLWINDPYTPYYAMVGGHLYCEAARRGYHPVVRAVSTQADVAAEWQAPDSLADGLMALDVREPLLQCLDAYPSIAKPMVGLGALCLETIDHVRVDLECGATDAVRHLVASRPERVVALLFRKEDPRTRAYERVMAEAGRQAEVVLIADETRATNRAMIAEYVARRGCPSAFFCQNDDVAIAVCRGLWDTGRRVPDDVAVVGCDGIEDGEYLPTPLSTIVHPVDAMCATAWRFLTNRMEDPTLPRQAAVLASKLVVRATSAQ
jgi:LacI family transcriptional regulator